MQVNEYVLKNPDTLETPVMLVFQDQLEHNIASIIEVTGGPDRVVPHFKTHKSKEVLKQLPMEFSVEAQKLLSLTLEGSVG